MPLVDPPETLRMAAWLGSPELPRIVVALRPPAGPWGAVEGPWLASTTASFVLHAVVGWALAQGGWWLLPKVDPPERGRAAIELVASMPAAASALTDRSDEPPPQRIEPATPPAMRPDAAPTVAAVEPPSLAAAGPSPAAAVERPARAADAVPPRPVDTASPGTSLERPGPADLRRSVVQSGRVPPPRPVADRPLERSAAHVEPRVELPPVESAPSPDSAASAASAAARGSDTPTVPRVVHNPAPAYPAAALAERRAGRVVLRVAVDRQGRVVSATVERSSGADDLDRAALEAVRSWKFEPIERLAEGATLELAVPVRFVLADPPAP